MFLAGVPEFIEIFFLALSCVNLGTLFCGTEPWVLHYKMRIISVTNL